MGIPIGEKGQSEPKFDSLSTSMAPLLFLLGGESLAPPVTVDECLRFLESRHALLPPWSKATHLSSSADEAPVP